MYRKHSVFLFFRTRTSSIFPCHVPWFYLPFFRILLLFNILPCISACHTILTGRSPFMRFRCPNRLKWYSSILLSTHCTFSFCPIVSFLILPLLVMPRIFSKYFVSKLWIFTSLFHWELAFAFQDGSEGYTLRKLLLYKYALRPWYQRAIIPMLGFISVYIQVFKDVDIYFLLFGIMLIFWSFLIYT